ncbi:MAG: hypothetical protein KF893_12325 [Caldilineaceae bacterium]|nr:hypothetical protein [Caldilineaceae bacterium]
MSVTPERIILTPGTLASISQSPLPTPAPVYGAEDLVVVAETQLTTDGSVMGGVTISSRGDRIAFLKRSDHFLELSPQKGRMVTPLWVMDRDGSNAVQIADDAQWPAWEANGMRGGSRIAYVREIQSEWARMYLVNVQTKQIRTLGEMPWQRPFWDGPERVAFVAEQRLRVWRNDQVIQRSTLEMPGDVVFHQIYPSPDGQKLFFARKQELWLADVQTGAMQQVADRGFLGYVNGVAWSPASNKAAFPIHHDGLWVMDLTTGERQKISDLTVTGVTWSPQADILAFTGQEVAGSGTAMFTEIYLINADGTGIQQLTQNESPDSVVAWMPDSLDLLIGRSAAEGGKGDLWILSLAVQPSWT